MDAPEKVDIVTHVNGVRRSVTVETRVVLADLLRDRFRLKGSKIACDAGVCGACTVLVDGVPVAACSTMAFEVDGCAVTTIEGVGTGRQLDSLQEGFLSNDAFQCGFCTPGMILSIQALLARHPQADDPTIREWLGGNLCRCTGYQMIVETVNALVSRGLPCAGKHKQ